MVRLDLTPATRPGPPAVGATVYLDLATGEIYAVKADGTRVSLEGGGSGSFDHATLSHLAWPASGHTGTPGAPAVAAFDAAGASAEVPAASDETFLVRQGGVLQWIPIVVALSFSVYGETLGNEEETLISMPNFTAWLGGSIV